MNAEELARLFHETYTRLASQHGKDASSTPDEQIVLAVCREILRDHALIKRTSTHRGIKYG